MEIVNKVMLHQSDRASTRRFVGKVDDTNAIRSIAAHSTGNTNG